MAKLVTLKEAENIAATYIDANKIAVNPYAVDTNTLNGLTNKIGKQITLDGDYKEEELSFMDGETFDTAAEVEEYFINFAKAVDVDKTGANDDAPSRLTYMPPSYSKPLGEQTFKITRDYSEVEKAFLDSANLGTFIATTLKRLEDSSDLYKNAQKRELLGKYATKLMSIENDATFAKGKAYEAGARVKGGVVLEKMTAAENTYNDLDAAVTAGKAVKLDLVTELAIPTDAASGEALIKSVKKVAEKFKKPREGYSYNGNIASKAPKYILLIKEGIMPEVEVDTLAGAFQIEKLALPVEMRVVKDFGSNTDVWAMMVDERALKLFPSNFYVMSKENANGGFINYVKHQNFTAFYSLNCKAHVWKEA